jgi:hypothetical protein
MAAWHTTDSVLMYDYFWQANVMHRDVANTRYRDRKPGDRSLRKAVRELLNWFRQRKIVYYSV